MSVPVVIVNPNSAAGQTRRRWAQLESSIRDALGEFTPMYTERIGHATELARAALRGGADLVIAMGGDGTINEVVNGFFDGEEPVRKGAAFAVLPAGTGGDFVKSTGSPRLLADAARAIAEGRQRPRTIDVGRLRYTTSDGKTATRHFINVASFGVSGLVDSYVNASSKALGGKASFFLASLRATFAWHNVRVRLRLDNGPAHERKVYLVAVGNGCYFGGGMKIAPAARLDDGRFEVVTIGDVTRAQMIMASPRIYAGTHVSLPFVTVEHARKLVAEPVDGSEVLLDVDGEQPGRLPATFEILPGAIGVVG